MSEMVFDTLSYARRMEAVGFTRQQAEAMAEEQAKLIDERLATKADLERLEMRLTNRLGGLMVIAVGAVAALVKLL